MKKLLSILCIPFLFAGCLKQLQPYPQDERLLIAITAPVDETDHPKLADAMTIIQSRVTSILTRSQRYRVIEKVLLDSGNVSLSYGLKPEDLQNARKLNLDAVLKIRVLRLVFSEKKPGAASNDGISMESVCAIEGQIVSIQSGEVLLSAIGEGAAKVRSSDPAAGGKMNITDRKSLMTDSLSIAAEDLADQLARNAVRKGAR